MQPDVLTIHRFYQSSLGEQTGQLLAERIANFFPPHAGGITVGLGYSLPYLDHLQKQEPSQSSARFLAFMPAGQGVCHWPTLEDSRTALVDPYHLPLGDASVERLLLTHAIEHINRPANLLREAWRVLAPEGQILVVAPNRLRTWSAAEATPFGHGRPYSKHQLYRMMSDQMLTPDAWETGLMQPPFTWPGATKLMRTSERVIGSMGRALGGALIVSARKQVYGEMPKGTAKARTVPVFTRSP